MCLPENYQMKVGYHHVFFWAFEFFLHWGVLLLLPCYIVFSLSVALLLDGNVP